MNLPHSFVVKP